MEGETAETNVNPGDARAELRRYFGKNYEAAFKKENVERWLKDLGLVLCKRDIHDGAAKMAEYLMDVKGYSTGEDFVTGEQGGIEEARTNAGIELSDVSTRSIWRYMTDNVPVVEKTVNQTAWDSPGKSQTTLTSQQTADANEALVKIANATSCKRSRWQSSPAPHSHPPFVATLA